MRIPAPRSKSTIQHNCHTITNSHVLSHCLLASSDQDFCKYSRPFGSSVRTLGMHIPLGMRSRRRMANIFKSCYLLLRVVKLNTSDIFDIIKVSIAIAAIYRRQIFDRDLLILLARDIFTSTIESLRQLIIEFCT